MERKFVDPRLCRIGVSMRAVLASVAGFTSSFREHELLNMAQTTICMDVRG